MFTRAAAPQKGLPVCATKIKLFNTPGYSWIVGPNIAVQYSRPLFFPPQYKRKKLSGYTRLNEPVVVLLFIVTGIYVTNLSTIDLPPLS